MKKTTIIIISAAAVCVITVCVLFLTGILHFPGAEKNQQTKKPELCVEYMNSYMLVDQDGFVVGSEAEKPAEIPEVSGISFSRIVVGEELTPAEENEYDYARRIIDSLKRNEFMVDEVYISAELEATLYVGDLKILLGTDNKTEDKLKELRDFFDDAKEMGGVLDMQELSRNNLGYSLKPDKE